MISSSVLRKIMPLLLAVFLVSCASSKKIVYLQGETGEQKGADAISYEPKIQLDDLLMITVTAENPELALPYNVIIPSASGTSSTIQATDARITYLIDKEGNINFPVLGKIKLAGLTRIEAVKKIQGLLKSHLNEPGVNVRILNFKVSVLGEVNRPGLISLQTERITLLDAISAAGDLTIYGKRNAISIIREKDGVKTITKVDITKSDFINSPNYYLSQNDVVYVEPNKTKVNASVVGPNIAVIFSVVSLVITVITLVTSHK